jgi:hypothetical protein
MMAARTPSSTSRMIVMTSSQVRTGRLPGGGGTAYPYGDPPDGGTAYP